MKALFKTQTLPKIFWVTWTLGLALSYGCTSTPTTSSGLDTAGNAVPRNPDGMTLIRGNVVNLSAKKITIKTKDSAQTIILSDSLHLYARTPGSLAAVKNTSFIGVTTQQQADGSDQATEIHIFPEALRGLGEGSFMMDTLAGTASRMTNGAASRMTNGGVQKADGASLVIQYQGKSRTVKVPTNIPVTTYSVTNKKLSPGDKVVALAKRDATGNYSTSKILISGK